MAGHTTGVPLLYPWANRLDRPDLEFVPYVPRHPERVRDHGGLLFIDLRDHYGLTQVVADPDSPAFKTLDRIRVEWEPLPPVVGIAVPDLVDPFFAAIREVATAIFQRLRGLDALAGLDAFPG